MLGALNTALLTGFEAFDGASANPSALIAQALDGREIRGRNVHARVLPARFGQALTELRRAITAVRPELIICLGQAGGRAALAVERVAINVSDARIPDNAGKQPIDRPVVQRGPVGYWSTLPIKAIVRRLRDAGLPAEVSQSAGTFVCNHVFYGLMHTLATTPGVRGGFIHVPYVPEQAAALTGGAPSMSLVDQVCGIELALDTALGTRRDRRLAGGATH